MKFKRSSGILLHITSLPGKFGTGTLGGEAKDFADTAVKAGFTYWQILPLNPVNGAFGYSPYASSSAFAGNPLFISPEAIADEHWFKGTLDTASFTEDSFADFRKAETFIRDLVRRSLQDFMKNAFKSEKARYAHFCNENEWWLDDYSLFSSLASHFDTLFWPDWDEDIAARTPGAMEHWKKILEEEIEYYKFQQFLFFMQWQQFKQHVSEAGLELIGDIPIYITFESADAWSHPEILQINKKTGLPLHVAGVPPDYFSENGQRWGNPLYQWFDDAGTLKEATAQWWLRRISHIRNLLDVVRIDHFRGFEAYWSIPYEEKTAVKGKWIPGPGKQLFELLKKELGDLPLIAEDLGVITPAVEQLRDEMGFPGMKILQFAFDQNNKNTYLPHNIENSNCILYTGTHDNNTSNGWFYGDEIDDATRQYVKEYLGFDCYNGFHQHLVRLAYRSVANLVIVPCQDLLGYGHEFRMNKPGTTAGNWGWKLRSGAITEEVVAAIRRMARIYRRLPD